MDNYGATGAEPQTPLVAPTTAPFRLVVVGTDARDWVRAARALTGVKVVAIVGGRDGRRARRSARRLAFEIGVGTPCPSLEEAAAHGDLDGALVVGPWRRVGCPVSVAFERGLNVFCGGSFARSQEVSKWIDAARTAKRVLAVDYGHPLRVAEVIDSVRDGAIGKPEGIDANWTGPRVLEGLGSLLSVGLPLLEEKADAVSAAVTDGWIEMTVFSHGREVGRFASRGERFSGLGRVAVRGQEGDVVIQLTDDPEANEARRSLLIRRSVGPRLGAPPRSAHEARVLALHDWVRTSRNRERGWRPVLSHSSPGIALYVEDVLDAARRSAADGGRNAELPKS